MLPHRHQLVLGSGSKTRRQLLQRLGYPFECLNANIDETRLDQETPKDLVTRLAKQKALAVINIIQQKYFKQGFTANQPSHYFVIGSDEVMVNCATQNIIGKPRDAENALDQIQQNSNQWVHFYTSLYIIKVQSEDRLEDRQASPNLNEHFDCYDDLAITEVRFRAYDPCEAQAVLDIDQPLQCAGSFRSEGVSLRLCQSINEPQPGALMGLPLISVNLGLRELGFTCT